MKEGPDGKSIRPFFIRRLTAVNVALTRMGFINPMTAENDPVAPADIAPAAAPVKSKRKFRPSPLVIAYAGFFVMLGASAAALNFVGDSRDASPAVSIKLRSFPSVGEASSMKVGVYHQTREIGGNLVADPALIEDSPQGPLPKIAKGGRTSLKAYGRVVVADGKKPRIAIVLRGLGVGQANTELALSLLPPDVTFGFAPFASDLQDKIDKARGAGHEVLLEAPMEPFDFPDSDPGPHALLAAASAEENGKRLDWTLSRATGYVGVMNLLGGRLLGEEMAIEPVLAHIASRGLMFFDDGASSNSVAVTSARHVKAPLVIGTLTLDGIQTPSAIDSKLVELENSARQDGLAIGVASAYPVTIARLTDWARRAESRGFQIISLSGLAAQQNPEIQAAKAGE